MSDRWKTVVPKGGDAADEKPRQVCRGFVIYFWTVSDDSLACSPLRGLVPIGTALFGWIVLAVTQVCARTPIARSPGANPR